MKNFAVVCVGLFPVAIYAMQQADEVLISKEAQRIVQLEDENKRLREEIKVLQEQLRRELNKEDEKFSAAYDSCDSWLSLAYQNW